MHTKFMAGLSTEDKCFIENLVAETKRPDMREYYEQTAVIARKIESLSRTTELNWEKLFPKNKDIGTDVLEIMVQQGFDFLLKEDLLSYLAIKENNRIIEKNKLLFK